MGQEEGKDDDWGGLFNNVVERLRDINLAEIDFDNPPPELYEGIEELIPYNEEEDELAEEEELEYVLEGMERVSKPFD
jgi:hypothetical protein